jgi:hypothetical protein
MVEIRGQGGDDAWSHPHHHGVDRILVSTSPELIQAVKDSQAKFLNIPAATA